MLKLRGGSDIDWRYFLAGGICAATSHGITTPIDVVKTKMQTSPEKYKDGVLAAAKDIVKTEGAAFLLAGLGTKAPLTRFRTIRANNRAPLTSHTCI